MQSQLGKLVVLFHHIHIEFVRREMEIHAASSTERVAAGESKRWIDHKDPKPSRRGAEKIERHIRRRISHGLGVPIMIQAFVPWTRSMRALLITSTTIAAIPSSMAEMETT